MAKKAIKFSQEVADQICELTASSSLSLPAIIEQVKDSPKLTTIYKWLRENEAFAKDYARAKEDQADYLAEEIIRIADDSSEDLEGINEYGKPIENKEFVNRSKLRVDARKWIASKLKPKKYGEKLDVTSDYERLPSTLNVTIVPPNEE